MYFIIIFWYVYIIYFKYVNPHDTLSCLPPISLHPILLPLRIQYSLNIYISFSRMQWANQGALQVWGGRLFTVGCALYQWVHFEVNISSSSMSCHLDLNSCGGMGPPWALSLPQWGADILNLWRSRAVNQRCENHSARVQYPCHAHKLAFYITLPAFLSTYIPAAASCVMFSKLCGEVWSVEMFIKRWMDKENIVYTHNEIWKQRQRFHFPAVQNK